MSLDHLVAPEHKEVLFLKKVHNDGVMSKGHGSQMKDLPKPKAE